MKFNYKSLVALIHNPENRYEMPSEPGSAEKLQEQQGMISLETILKVVVPLGVGTLAAGAAVLYTAKEVESSIQSGLFYFQIAIAYVVYTGVVAYVSSKK